MIRQKEAISAADNEPTNEYEAELAAQHAKIDKEEAEILLAISAQFKKSREIDMLFAKYCPHLPAVIIRTILRSF